MDAKVIELVADGKTALGTGDASAALTAFEAAVALESRFWGTVDLRGYFRKPFGPGWGLVGDAGYHKHPITGMGMTDAFVDAERIAAALDDMFSGRQTFAEPMGYYQKTRDEHVTAMYDMTCQFATLEPPPVEMQRLLAAVSTNDNASTDFVSMQAGTLPVPEFFDPENVGRIMAGAAT